MNFSTFSIVAKDPETGDLGVAGGTNWFNYGRWVPHVEAGLGAVATQAETNMNYVPLVIKALKNGRQSKEAIEYAIDQDKDSQGVYQLLVIDNSGNTYCHTGKNCHDYAGFILEKDIAVAGNTLVSKETLIQTIEYYKKSNLPFPLKLIKALQIGQSAGGDIRGMKSAALKITKGNTSGKEWEDVIYDLRVDENTDPLKELERLFTIAEAYRFIGKAESSDNDKEGLLSYLKALKLDPTNQEVKFWLARLYNKIGQLEKSIKLMKEISFLNPRWEEYWQRLDKKIN